MSKPAERNVHNADTPDFSVPDDGHGTPTSNTIGILLDACQTAKRITEACWSSAWRRWPCSHACS